MIETIKKGKALSTANGNGVAQSHVQSDGVSYNSDGYSVKSCRLCGGKAETLSGLCRPCWHRVYQEWGERCKEREFELHLHEYIEQKVTAAGAAQAPVARVGQFTVLPDGTIIGPKEYLESEHFTQIKAEIESGNHPVLRAALGAGQSIENAVLVTVVTDYAAWRGTKELHAALRVRA